VVVGLIPFTTEKEKSAHADNDQWPGILHFFIFFLLALAPSDGHNPLALPTTPHAARRSTVGG
jgi:hypothetical protein